MEAFQQTEKNPFVYISGRYLKPIKNWYTSDFYAYKYTTIPVFFSLLLFLTELRQFGEEIESCNQV